MEDKKSTLQDFFFKDVTQKLCHRSMYVAIHGNLQCQIFLVHSLVHITSYTSEKENFTWKLGV
jgi:hypothetical protein